jgi:hypothetical protein
MPETAIAAPKPAALAAIGLGLGFMTKQRDEVRREQSMSITARIVVPT